MSSYFKKIIVTIFSTVFIFALQVNAQLSSSGNGDIFVNMNPENPRAGQDVSLSIESYSTDLNRADISWFVDKKLEQNGIGIKNFFTKSGKMGEVTTIDVQIQSREGGLIRKTIIIKPAEVDLLWEADTLTIPFYKGKALNSSDSQIKIVAVPDLRDSNGVKINPKNLIYEWKKDYKVIPNTGGYGKNFIIVDGPQTNRDYTISVFVNSADNLSQAKNSIFMKSATAKILFYENNPALGPIFEKALSNRINLQKDEINILAFPFFFSSLETDGYNISYIWQMNGKKIEEILTDEIVFRRTGSLPGSSNISLRIQNFDKILQFASNNFDVVFGESSQNKVLFGL